MSVYAKLNQARKKFHALKLKKSGHNKFAGYDYFELGDFLIPTLNVFDEVGLCGIVSFDKDNALMQIVPVDAENKEGEVIVITSPMGSAALKGCHEVQKIGAVETNQRRYLWMAALEIVEHDALDASVGKESKGTITPTTGAEEAIDPARKELLTRIAQDIASMDYENPDELSMAHDMFYGISDNEEKIYAGICSSLHPSSAQQSKNTMMRKENSNALRTQARQLHAFQKRQGRQ